MYGWPDYFFTFIYIFFTFTFIFNFPINFPFTFSFLCNNAMVAKRQVECMAGRITFLRGQPENWGTQQPITHPLFIFSLFSNVFHLHICKSVMCQYSDWSMCNRLTIDWGFKMVYFISWQRWWLVPGFFSTENMVTGSRCAFSNDMFYISALQRYIFFLTKIVTGSRCQVSRVWQIEAMSEAGDAFVST